MMILMISTTQTKLHLKEERLKLSLLKEEHYLALVGAVVLEHKKREVIERKQRQDHLQFHRGNHSPLLVWVEEVEALQTKQIFQI